MADKQEIEYKDGMNVIELVNVFERRTIDTLVPKIEAVIKPYQEKQIENLQKELDDARVLFGEVEKTFLGQREIRKAIKRLNKPKEVVSEKDPLEIFKNKPIKKFRLRVWILRFIYFIGIVTLIFSIYSFLKYLWS